jgi:hypothetical protein
MPVKTLSDDQYLSNRWAGTTNVVTRNARLMPFSSASNREKYNISKVRFAGLKIFAKVLIKNR